jgi:hypothetical protein
MKSLRMRLAYNIKAYFRELGYEDGKWMAVAQDLVQWRTLMLAVLNLRVNK